MSKRITVPTRSEKCDDCVFAVWHVDKEWNFSCEEHLPLTFHCKHNLNETLIRGNIACNEYRKKL